MPGDPRVHGRGMPCVPLPLPLDLIASSCTPSPNTETYYCHRAASSFEGIIEIQKASLRDVIERFPLTIRLLGG
jgi:hypothetical protein